MLKDIFIFCPDTLHAKPQRLMYSLYQAAKRAGLPVRIGPRYQPCALLVLYGWGGRKQQAAIKQHSGRYVAFDLGYWRRQGMLGRKWRVSIDGFHCPERIMAGPVPGEQRWKMDGLEKVQGTTPVRPKTVLLVGNAPKSVRVVAQSWAAEKSREILKALPDHKIIYRPKPKREPEKHVKFHKISRGEPIEHVLRHVGLVVCRHSNVAVDACRMGVPVVCEDGAGASIYPRALKDYKRQPSYSERLEFIIRLAWWQWSINDINQGGFWEWLSGEIDRI